VKLALRSAVVVVALTVALALLACSDDGDFEERAAAVCDESADDISVASAQLTSQSTAEQVAAFLHDTYVPELRERLAALRDLDPPAEVAAALDDYEDVVDSIGADPAAFAGQTADPFADVDARLDELGLEACGSRPAG
jgi:hypothetical protein